MKPGEEIEWDREAGYCQQGGQAGLPDKMSWAFKEKRKKILSQGKGKKIKQNYMWRNPEGLNILINWFMCSFDIFY